ncbi:MAG: hypothetical protein ACRC46_14810 [Thermoguttaceae bacterium]
MAKGLRFLVAAVSGMCGIIRAKDVGVFLEDYMRAGYIRQLTVVSTHIDSAIKGLRLPLHIGAHIWPQELEEYFESLHKSKTNPSYLSQAASAPSNATATPPQYEGVYNPKIGATETDKRRWHLKSQEQGRNPNTLWADIAKEEGIHKGNGMISKAAKRYAKKHE